MKNSPKNNQKLSEDELQGVTGGTGTSYDDSVEINMNKQGQSR